MDLIVELALSWLLLWIFYRKNLSVLGIKPNTKRMMNLAIGFFIASTLCAFNYLLQTVFSGSTWHLNNDFSIESFFSVSWWTMHSVLYEELIFRGALLYLAVIKLGEKKACLLSAVCFGIYHWFSMNAFGNWLQMVFVFSITGIMGYVFALAFTKTKSLYLPIGVHFGWNLVNTVVFSQGPIGNQLLIPKVGERFNVIENIIVFILSSFALPLVSFLYLKAIEKDKAEIEATSPSLVQ